jgi:peroxiredoxin-like protein
MGSGLLRTDGLDVQASIPKEMGGPGIGTNPDELLLAAAANCYLITLASIMENRKLDVRSLELGSEGTVIRDGGRLAYKRIVHKPVITLAEGAGPEQRELAEQCAHRAEKACMISQALRGNVDLAVEPEIR